MKKKVLALLLSVSTMFAFSGCSEASKVSHNLSLEADNFNDVLQVTVINCLQGDVLFQMTGKMSITADTSDNQLEVVVEDEKGEYKKHFIGLSVDYAKSERQFRVNGAAVPFPTAHQRRSLFIDFITLAHAYSVHSFQDGKNAFCQ